MDDSNTQICRLCLGITRSCESKPIKDIKKETLQVLPFKIYFYTSISGDAVACKRCLERLQDWFDFKTRCSITMNANFKTTIKAKFLHLMSSGSTCQKNSEGCWLCTSSIKVETFNCTTDRKGGLLKDMIGNCFPKVYLNTGRKILLCQPCLSNIKKYYEFMKTCREVERRIELFRAMSPHDTIILEDVLNFKEDNVLDRPLIIKKEYLDVDKNAMKCLENEEATSIKCEEIHIKDELDAEVTVRDSHQSDDGHSFVEAGLSKTTAEEKNHVGSRCPYYVKWSHNLKNHIQTRAENEQHNCTVCSLCTDARLLLQERMPSHRGATKKYGCCECSYETIHKNDIEQHLINHKDTSKVEMYKGLLRPLQCKYKAALAKHRNLQRRNITKMYECQECSFSTEYKDCFVRHNTPSVDPKVEYEFKCEKCPFRTKWQATCKQHMTYHSHGQFKHGYSCDQCDYSCKRRSKLLQHQLLHQTNGERQMYNCKLCEYQAKYLVNINAHMKKIHMDYYEVIKFKCTQCPYKTAFKSNLLSHIRCRHDNKRQRPFKCELCEFSAKSKSHLKRHQLTHTELGEAMWYYCATCDYKTIHKDCLKLHTKNCAKRTKITDDKIRRKRKNIC